MKIVILSSDVKSALNNYFGININSNNKFYVLICGSKTSNKYKFWLRVLFHFIFRLSLKQKIAMFSFLTNSQILLTYKSIHSPKVIKWLKNITPEIGIHGINVIYRKELLECFKVGLLNAHLGTLPKYRGKNVVAWSIFNGDETGISTFIIDEGIDTGKRIIHSEIINTKFCNNVNDAKNILLSKVNFMYAMSIQKLSSDNIKFRENNISLGKRYYKMSNLFSNISNQYLQNRIRNN
jgi:methionyl-tRNA formyltransferase